jgi:hypothetical protein
MKWRNPQTDLDLPASSLYLLAAPGTPQEARNAVIEQAKAGEKVSRAVKTQLGAKHV